MRKLIKTAFAIFPNSQAELQNIHNAEIYIFFGCIQATAMSSRLDTLVRTCCWSKVGLDCYPISRSNQGLLLGRMCTVLFSPIFHLPVVSKKPEPELLLTFYSH